MNRIALALVAGAVSGAALAATASVPARALAGRYSSHFRNGMVSGERYASDDVAEIVPVDATHAYIRFELQFYNGHSCSLYGVASADRGGLVYREPAGDQVGATRCVLRIEHRGRSLAFDDGDDSCRSFCGQRGTFGKGSLPWASRRAISYLPRLKASEEYQEAMAKRNLR